VDVATDEPCYEEEEDARKYRPLDYYSLLQ
jgi:hypothetical protein